MVLGTGATPTESGDTHVGPGTGEQQPTAVIPVRPPQARQSIPPAVIDRRFGLKLA